MLAFRALVVVAALAGMAKPALAFAPPPGGPPSLSDVCSRATPCVGYRGGVYYITPSGFRRYLPRD